MKKGKKSRLALGIILILVLMFVGTTVVAASEDPRMFTWSPETIYAGDVGRTYTFTPPEEIEFVTYMDLYTTNPGSGQEEWIRKAQETRFTKTLDELKEMYAADPSMAPAFEYKYPSPVTSNDEIFWQSTVDPFIAMANFPAPGTFDLRLTVSYRWIPPVEAWDPSRGSMENIDRTEWIAKSAQDLPEAIHTQITVEKGQPIVDGIWHQFSGDEFNDIVMNELAMKAGDTNIPAEASSYRWKNRNKVWYRPDGVYVCAHKTAAGDGMDPPYEDPITVTVYVKDGDKKVDLGEKEFRVTDLNDPNGRKRSVVPAIPGDVEYDLNVVPYDGAALSGLKLGVYTLLADTSATVANDVTTNEVGTLTVTGISKVSVDPASSSVEKGAAQQFTANVDVVETDQDKVDDKTVAWSVSGQKSADTKIDSQTGMLTVGDDEPAGNAITVTAESNYDNYGQGKVRGEAKVTVTEPDHSVTGGTTEIKEGQDGNWSFKGKFANLSRLSLNGTDFTIVPESATRAQLKYPGYNAVAGIAVEGSVDVTLYKEFLATLPAGEYKLEATFNDGGVQNIGSMQFNIVRKAQPTATAAPETKAPKTGDETDVWLWIVLAAAGACILGAAARRKAGKAGVRNK